MATRKMFIAEDAGEGCWVTKVDEWYVPWWCPSCGQKNHDAGPNCFMCNKLRWEMPEEIEANE